MEPAKEKVEKNKFLMVLTITGRRWGGMNAENGLERPKYCRCDGDYPGRLLAYKVHGPVL